MCSFPALQFMKFFLAARTYDNRSDFPNFSLSNTYKFEEIYTTKSWSVCLCRYKFNISAHTVRTFNVPPETFF